MAKRAKLAMKRRGFLQSGLASLAVFSSASLGSILSAIASKAEEGLHNKLKTLIGGLHRYPKNFNRDASYDFAQFSNTAIFKFDVVSKDFQFYECRTPIHHSIVVPGQTHLTISISRRCNIIGIFDWNAKAETKSLVLPPNYYAYGHGSLSSDGKKLVFTSYKIASSQQSEQQFIGIVNLETFEDSTKVRFIPAAEGPNHDVVHIGNDRFLIASTSKGKQGAAFLRFDLKSEAVETTYSEPFPSETTLTLGHFYASPRDPQSIFTTVFPVRSHISRPCTVLSYNVENRKTEILVGPAVSNLPIELLSIAATGDTAYFTAPGDHSVYSLNLKSRKVSRVLETKSETRGIYAFCKRLDCDWNSRWCWDL